MNVNKSPFADFSFSLFCFRDFLYFLLLLLLLLLLGWTFTSFVLLCFALRQFGVKKENVTIENIGEIMLCQVPGISTTISKVIITKYKTIKGLLQSLEDDPTCLDGLSYDLKGKSRKINSTAMKNIKKYLSC